MILRLAAVHGSDVYVLHMTVRREYDTGQPCSISIKALSHKYIEFLAYRLHESAFM